MSAKIIKRVTFVGMIANLGLAIVKYVIGVVGHSNALIADAVHSLSDIVTDLAILIGVRFWSQPADEGHPHGHQKIEVMVSLTIGIILALVGVGLVYNSIMDIHEGNIVAPTGVAAVAALFSIVVKEVLFQYTYKRGVEIKSSSLIANAWHHRSDAMSSIPVVIAIIIAMIYPDFAMVDQIGAVIVSGFIFKASYNIIHEAVAGLVDAGASPDIIDGIECVTLGMDEVKGFHNLRTRCIAHKAFSVDLHVEVDGNMKVRDADVIAHKVMDAIVEKVDEVVDVVVHIDPDDPDHED